MKSFLLNGFEDFITGSGIWILVGCLAAALLVSVIFLILNIEKEKKMRERGNTPLALQTENEIKTERVQPVEVKRVDEKEKEETAVEENKEVAEEVKEETKIPARAKTPARAPAKKVETIKEEKPVKKAEPEVEEGGDYDISYDAEAKQWVVKRENSQRATKRTKTKQEAIDYAKPLADKYEVKLIIHNKKDE